MRGGGGRGADRKGGSEKEVCQSVREAPSVKSGRLEVGKEGTRVRGGLLLLLAVTEEMRGVKEGGKGRLLGEEGLSYSLQVLRFGR